MKRADFAGKTLRVKPAERTRVTCPKIISDSGRRIHSDYFFRDSKAVYRLNTLRSFTPVRDRKGRYR